MKVESFMTSDVLTVPLEMTVRRAISLFSEKKVDGVPVVDGCQNVVTVLSEGDLLKLAAQGCIDKPIGGCLPKLAKTEKLITLNRFDSFSTAYKLFLSHSVHRIIVTDSNGKLQGIVTRRNVLSLLVEGKAVS